MNRDSQLSTQALVFFLVRSAFTTVYITQPVLPVIENEFAVDARTASLSVAMVIFGIALANLPFGMDGPIRCACSAITREGEQKSPPAVTPTAATPGPAS
jgi:hypothetical protein